MVKLRYRNIEIEAAKVPMSGDTVEELEEYFAAKHENILNGWEYFESGQYTEDTGPR